MADGVLSVSNFVDSNIICYNYAIDMLRICQC